MVILVFHIAAALLSMAVSALAWLSPSVLKLRLTGVLIAATLASGTYLVISLHSPLMSSCLTGLAYLAFTLSGLLLGQRKLQKTAKNTTLLN